MKRVRTWEDELADRGQNVRPGAGYTCPHCEQPRHAFAIVEVNDEWVCTTCAAGNEPDPVDLTWEDVRGQRAVFLQATDWSQLPDVPDATSAAFAPLRQRARDVTDLHDVDAALAALAALRDEAASL